MLEEDLWGNHAMISVNVKENLQDPRVPISFHDLLPTAGELWLVAYESLVGDTAMWARGVHQGRNIHRPDTMRLTKAQLYDAALCRDMTCFRHLWAGFVQAPFRLPASVRTYIPKDGNDSSKGQRPIDDPSELKRLLGLFARAKVQKRLEAFLTPGQLGGRPKSSFEVLPCPREGATMQDHVAWSIRQAAWRGKPFCLSVDLKDAFGNVPQRLAVKLLRKKLNMTEAAARWIWRLAMIDCIIPQSPRRRIRKPGMGIEQGGPLSSMIMNLILAPMIRELEETLRVEVYTYLDDVYIMSTDMETAQKAFSLFKSLASSQGPRNVRDLRVHGEVNDSKASEIVDLKTETVTVLKTFHVSEQGIVPVKEVVDQLVQRGVVAYGETTIRQLRELIGQSLSRRLTKDRFPGLLSSRPPKGSEETGAVSPYPGGDGGGPATKEDERATPLVSVSPSVRGDIDVEGALMDLPLVRGVHGLPVQGEDLPCVVGTGSGLSPVGVDAPMEKKNLFLSERETLLLGVCGLPSQQAPEESHEQEHQDQGVLMDEESLDPTEGNSSEVVDMDREQIEPGSQAVSLSIHHPDVVEANREGRPIRLGEKFKGCSLNLTGLEVLGIEEHRIPEVVGALIRAVRTSGRARVTIPMLERWTGPAEIFDRKLYKVCASHLGDDGERVVDLRLRRSPAPPLPARYRRAPSAALAIEGFRPAGRGMGQAEFHLRSGKGAGRLSVAVMAVNHQAQAAEALLRLLEASTPRSVVVPLEGSLACLRFLVDTDCLPRHTELSRCFAQLRTMYRWRQESSYLVGAVK